MKRKWLVFVVVGLLVAGLAAFVYVSAAATPEPTAAPTIAASPTPLPYGVNFPFTPPAKWHKSEGVDNVWEVDIMPYDWHVSDGQLVVGLPSTPAMNEPVNVTLINVPLVLFEVDEGTSFHVKGHWWTWKNEAEGVVYTYFVVEEVTIND